MVAHVDGSPGSPSWLRLARRAKLLATLTLVWLGIEGTVGVVAGISAGSLASLQPQPCRSMWGWTFHSKPASAPTRSNSWRLSPAAAAAEKNKINNRKIADHLLL